MRARRLWQRFDVPELRDLAKEIGFPQDRIPDNPTSRDVALAIDDWALRQSDPAVDAVLARWSGLEASRTAPSSATAALPPPATIFLSGTADLEPYKRRALQTAGYYGVPAWLDVDNRQAGQPRDICLEQVRRCEKFFLFLGRFYGQVQEGLEISPTEDEYEQARAANKPIFVFVERCSSREERQLAFLERVRSYSSGHWRWTFGSAEDVGSLVHEILAARPARTGAATMSSGERSIQRWHAARHRIEQKFPDVVGQLALPDQLRLPYLTEGGLRASPDFVGRAVWLEQIVAALKRRTSMNIYAVHGLGGVGKSELAKQVALRLQREDAFPDGYVWLSLEASSRTSVLGELASHFLDLPRITEPSVQLAILRELLRDFYPLIVLDNADDPDVLAAVCQPLAGKTLLITSRRHTGSRDAIDLEDLAPEEAEELYWTLYSRRLGCTDGADRERAGPLVREIVKCLSYHALSIDIVAGNAALNNQSLAETLADLRRRGLLAVVREPGSDLHSDERHRDIRKILGMAIENLGLPPGVDYLGTTLFAICGALCGRDFYYEELTPVLENYLRLFKEERDQRGREVAARGESGLIHQLLGWSAEPSAGTVEQPDPDARGVSEVLQLLSGSPSLREVFDRLVATRVIQRSGPYAQPRERFSLHPRLRDYSWSIMDQHLGPNVWKAVAEWTATKAQRGGAGANDQLQNFHFMLVVCRERDLPREFELILAASYPLFLRQGQWALAIDVLESAVAWLEARGVTPALARAHMCLGDLLVRKGDLEGGREHLQRARDAYRQLGNHRLVAWTTYWLTDSFRRRDPGETFAARARNLRFALQHQVFDVAASETRTLSALVDPWTNAGECWMLHRVGLREAFAAAFNIGIRLRSLAGFLRERQDFDLAAEVLGWVAALDECQPAVDDQRELLVERARLLLAQGDFSAAEAALEQTAAFTHQLNLSGPYTDELKALEVCLLLRRQDHAAARSYLLQNGEALLAGDSKDLIASSIIHLAGLQPGSLTDSLVDAATGVLAAAVQSETDSASMARFGGLLAAKSLLAASSVAEDEALATFVSGLRFLRQVGSAQSWWLSELEASVNRKVGYSRLSQEWAQGSREPSLAPVAVMPRDLPQVVRSVRDGRLMRLVPGGVCLTDDKAATAVWLPPFYLDVAPVSQLDFQRFLQADPAAAADPTRGDPDQPVTHATYDEAAAYCKWAGKVVPHLYELQRAALIVREGADEARWQQPITAHEIGPEVERVLSLLGASSESESAPPWIQQRTPALAEASSSARRSMRWSTSPSAGMTASQLLGCDEVSERVRHLVDLVAGSLFLTAANKERFLDAATTLDREWLDGLTVMLEEERLAVESLDTSAPQVHALVEFRAREWGLLVARRTGDLARASAESIEAADRERFDRLDAFSYVPPFGGDQAVDLDRCLAEDLGPEERAAAVDFLKRLFSSPLTMSDKRGALAALVEGSQGLYRLALIRDWMSAQRQETPESPERFSQTLATLQQAWRELAADFTRVASGPRKFFADQQALFGYRAAADAETGGDQQAVNPFHLLRSWDEPLGQAGDPGSLLPPHPASRFDEHRFLSLLSQSVSLSRLEKWQVLKATPRLSEAQIAELMRILEEEREKFSAVDRRHWPELSALHARHWQDWSTILAGRLGAAIPSPSTEEAWTAPSDVHDSRDHDVNLSKIDYSLLDRSDPPELAGNPFAAVPPCDAFLSSGVDIRAMIPAHPETYFSERRFLDLLGGSISLTGIEKWRIIKAIPRLSKEQVDGLIDILLEERRKFLALPANHWPELARFCETSWADWPDVVYSLLPNAPAKIGMAGGVAGLGGELWHWTSTTDQGGTVRWIAAGPEMKPGGKTTAFPARTQPLGEISEMPAPRIFRGAVPIFSREDLRDLLPVTTE